MYNFSGISWPDIEAGREYLTPLLIQVETFYQTKKSLCLTSVLVCKSYSLFLKYTYFLIYSLQYVNVCKMIGFPLSLLIHHRALLPSLCSGLQASLSLHCLKLNISGLPYNLFLYLAVTLPLKK